MRSPVLLAASVVVLSGCPGGGDSVDAGLPPLDCYGVFECVAACPSSTTTTCEDGCVARATPTAYAQVKAITDCAEAHTCGDSSDCLQANCAAELAACSGSSSTGGGAGGGTGTGTGGGSGTGGGIGTGGGSGTGGGGDDGGLGGGFGGGTGDGFPLRYVGTVTDDNSDFAGIHLHSSGNVSFIRDDSLDPRGSQGWAVYRVESLTYTASDMGTDLSGCTWSASHTVTVASPISTDGIFAINKTPNAGAYTYDITTSHSESFPNELTITCPPPIPSRVQAFSAENHVAAGVPLPTTTDLIHVQASVGAYMQPTRTWSWDLTGQN